MSHNAAGAECNIRRSLKHGAVHSRLIDTSMANKYLSNLKRNVVPVTFVCNGSAVRVHVNGLQKCTFDTGTEGSMSIEVDPADMSELVSESDDETFTCMSPLSIAVLVDRDFDHRTERTISVYGRMGDTGTSDLVARMEDIEVAHIDGDSASVYLGPFPAPHIAEPCVDFYAAYSFFSNPTSVRGFVSAMSMAKNAEAFGLAYKALAGKDLAIKAMAIARAVWTLATRLPIDSMDQAHIAWNLLSSYDMLGPLATKSSVSTAKHDFSISPPCDESMQLATGAPTSSGGNADKRVWRGDTPFTRTIGEVASTLQFLSTSQGIQALREEYNKGTFRVQEPVRNKSDAVLKFIRVLIDKNLYDVQLYSQETTYDTSTTVRIGKVGVDMKCGSALPTRLNTSA